MEYADCATIFFFFQAEDGIRDLTVTGVQTCALPITFWSSRWPSLAGLRETPRTAIVRGAKIGSSPAITPADGPRLANPAISPLASCPRLVLGSQIHPPHGLALGPLDLAEPAEPELG